MCQDDLVDLEQHFKSLDSQLDLTRSDIIYKYDRLERQIKHSNTLNTVVFTNNLNRCRDDLIFNTNQSLKNIIYKLNKFILNLNNNTLNTNDCLLDEDHRLAYFKICQIQLNNDFFMKLLNFKNNFDYYHKIKYLKLLRIQYCKFFCPDKNDAPINIHVLSRSKILVQFTNSIQIYRLENLNSDRLVKYKEASIVTYKMESSEDRIFCYILNNTSNGEIHVYDFDLNLVRSRKIDCKIEQLILGNDEICLDFRHKHLVLNSELGNDEWIGQNENENKPFYTGERFSTQLLKITKAKIFYLFDLNKSDYKINIMSRESGLIINVIDLLSVIAPSSGIKYLTKIGVTNEPNIICSSKGRFYLFDSNGNLIFKDYDFLNTFINFKLIYGRLENLIMLRLFKSFEIYYNGQKNHPISVSYDIF